MHLNDSSFDLAVVEVDSGVLERVPHAFLKVVPIPATGSGKHRSLIDRRTFSLCQDLLDGKIRRTTTQINK